MNFEGKIERLVVLMLAFGVGVGHSQTLGEAKGFKIADHYGPPNESQIKSLLEGAKARALSRAQYLLTDVTLQTFGQTNNVELLVKAPQCTYDATNHTASSPGPLRVQTADGKFSIEGEGFKWNQTNFSLFISNQVRSLIQPDLIASPAGESRAEPADATNEGILLVSDQFEYAADSGLGIYRGNMRVSGTNLDLAGGALTIELPMNGRELRAITATTNVVADYGGVHVTGEKALYATDTGLVRVTGQPTWEADQQEGHADELIIDRTNKVFTARGQAYLKMPGQSLGASSFLPAHGSQTRGLASATNQFVEIQSESYEIKTNRAVFRDHVRVSEQSDGQTQSRMSCAEMTVTFTGTNQLQGLTARDGVVIEQADKRLQGDEAVYTTVNATNGLLELTGNPVWRDGHRWGSGNLIQVDSGQSEMRVIGRASMKLPAAELGGFGKNAPGTSRLSSAKATTDGFAEITSKEYTLRPDRALFRGGVHLTYTNMDWACETLSAQMPAEGGRIDRMIADQRVIFNGRDAQGRSARGTGDRAVYDRKVAGAATNETIRLTGNLARLETTERSAKDGRLGTNVVVNDVIVWDLVRNAMRVAGKNYSIRGSAPTNATFLMPNKLTKTKFSK